jgi:hypothetical protein
MRGDAVMAANELMDRMRAALTPYLEPGEQLRAVGPFQSGGNLAELPKSSFFTMRDWWVGITDRRVILGKQGRLTGQLLPDGVFSVPLENVVMKKDLLLTVLRITSPDPKIPKRLQLMELMGADKDELKAALSREHVGSPA